MLLRFLLEYDLVLQHQPIKLLKYEFVFIVDCFPDGFGGEQGLTFFYHFHESFHLLFVFFPNISIRLYFKFQAFGVVDPVYSLCPGSAVFQFFKNILKLLFRRSDVFLVGVNY